MLRYLNLHFAIYLFIYLSYFVCFRLHGVCQENPLAPLIGRLGLPLYRTSGDNSVLYDHDLERYVHVFLVVLNVRNFLVFSLSIYYQYQNMESFLVHVNLILIY